MIIGISSLLPGYLKHHKKIAPIAFLLSGFTLIFIGHFLVRSRLEPVVTPIGALTVAFSHFLNWKFSKYNHSCNVHN